MDTMSISYFRFAEEHPDNFEVMFNTQLDAGGVALSESGWVQGLLKGRSAWYRSKTLMA
jgi:hypothetical protein